MSFLPSSLHIPVTFLTSAPCITFAEDMLIVSKAFYIKEMLANCIKTFKEHEENLPPEFTFWRGIRPEVLFYTKRIPLVSSEFNTQWHPLMETLIKNLMEAQDNTKPEKENLKLIEDQFFLELNNYQVEGQSFMEVLL